MNIYKLLLDMYPQGIPPAEYGRVAILIAHTAGAPAVSPPPAPTVRLTTSAAPKKTPAKRAAGRPRGRPPTGVSTKDRMNDILRSRGAVSLTELAKELGVHTGTVYLAIREGGAERFEQDGETFIRLPEAANAPQLAGVL